MQTILGSNGAVGTALAKALNTYTLETRLVSRAPRRVNPGDELMSLDLTSAESVSKAVAGSEVVYVTIGFPYQQRGWANRWLRFIENVLAACRDSGSRLVFFDNVLSYDPNALGEMTEASPVQPVSRKGQTRARVSEAVLAAHSESGVSTMVARSADLIAPQNSLIVDMVYRNLAAGEDAVWPGSLEKAHTCTYILDAARATAMLGNTPEAFGRVWHLPTDPTPRTGSDWVDLFSREMGLTPRVKLLRCSRLKLSGIVNAQSREFADVCYLYDRDYIFRSDEFSRRFSVEPTPAAGAVHEIIAAMRR